MKIKLAAGWGSLKPGEIVEVGGTLGRYLIGKNLAKAIATAPADKMMKGPVKAKTIS